MFICEEHISAPPGAAWRGGRRFQGRRCLKRVTVCPLGPSRPPVRWVSLTLAPNGGEAQGQGHGSHAVSPHPAQGQRGQRHAKPRGGTSLRLCPSGWAVGDSMSRQCPEPQTPHWNEAWEVRSLEERDLGCYPGPSGPSPRRRGGAGFRRPQRAPIPQTSVKGQLQNRRRPRPEVSHRAPQRRVMSTGIARRTEEPEGTQSGRPAPSPGPRAPAPPGAVTALGTGPPATEPGHRGGRRPAERGGVSSVRARGVWSGVG